MMVVKISMRHKFHQRYRTWEK